MTIIKLPNAIKHTDDFDGLFDNAIARRQFIKALAISPFALGGALYSVPSEAFLGFILRMVFGYSVRRASSYAARQALARKAVAASARNFVSINKVKSVVKNYKIAPSLIGTATLASVSPTAFANLLSFSPSAVLVKNVDSDITNQLGFEFKNPGNSQIQIMSQMNLLDPKIKAVVQPLSQTTTFVDPGYGWAEHSVNINQPGNFIAQYLLETSHGSRQMEQRLTIIDSEEASYELV